MSNSTPQPHELTNRGKELALGHFNHVEQQIGLAATKATLIVAANALLIGTYVTVVKELKIFPSFQCSIESWLFVLAAAFFILAFLMALLAALPNVRIIWNPTHSIENIFFFDSISNQKFEEYLRDFQASDRDGSLDKALLRQVWGKSCWLTKMFRLISISIFCTIAGTGSAVVALAFTAAKLLP